MQSIKAVIPEQHLTSHSYTQTLCVFVKSGSDVSNAGSKCFPLLPKTLFLIRETASVVPGKKVDVDFDILRLHYHPAERSTWLYALSLVFDDDSNRLGTRCLPVIRKSQSGVCLSFFVREAKM